MSAYNVMDNVQRLCYQVSKERDENQKACTTATRVMSTEPDTYKRVCFREMASYTSGRAEALGEVAQLLEAIMNEKEVCNAN